MKSHSKIGMFDIAASFLQAREKDADPLNISRATPLGQPFATRGKHCKASRTRTRGPSWPLQLHRREALEHLGDSTALLVTMHA
eukprot:9497726-Pyramimonas_sp.AAC.1